MICPIEFFLLTRSSTNKYDLSYWILLVNQVKYVKRRGYSATFVSDLRLSDSSDVSLVVEGSGELFKSTKACTVELPLPDEVKQKNINNYWVQYQKLMIH